MGELEPFFMLLAVALGSGLLGVTPARVAENVLLWSFFADVERTRSEAEFPPGPFVMLPVYDQFCRQCRLVPAGRGHEGPPDTEPVRAGEPRARCCGALAGSRGGRGAQPAARQRRGISRWSSSSWRGSTTASSPMEPWGDVGDELIRVVRRFVVELVSVSVYAMYYR
ncbi:putative carboxylesterase 15 [Panicum miliaceum]|uniref:Carboxylesterase 15 n=1 Tax=Panicum miliaceum TaxID=4540 RepID=A0A3L6TSE4_PANMI|nr:putative carboxylesterase 15 [Panicum miliaceum]